MLSYSLNCVALLYETKQHNEFAVRPSLLFPQLGESRPTLSRHWTKGKRHFTRIPYEQHVCYILLMHLT